MLSAPITCYFFCFWNLLDRVFYLLLFFKWHPAYGSSHAYLCYCQDWEDGLCESDADGSFLHENWNHDLRLFSDGEDGAPKLLQVPECVEEMSICIHLFVLCLLLKCWEFWWPGIGWTLSDNESRKHVNYFFTSLQETIWHEDHIHFHNLILRGISQVPVSVLELSGLKT